MHIFFSHIPSNYIIIIMFNTLVVELMVSIIEKLLPSSDKNQ